MTVRRSLEQELACWAGAEADRSAVAKTVGGVARAAGRISELLEKGVLAGDLGAPTGHHGLIDAQKQLDVIANDWIIEALRPAPVAWIISEEVADPILLNAAAPLIVAIDPIDGSSNIETNSAIGTIFSVLPSPPSGPGQAGLLIPGRLQLAAGFIVYGPQTTLALTYGDGTQLYTLNRDTSHFVLTDPHADIPPIASEFAVNVSNYRHWDAPAKVWLDDCLSGADGPRGRNFNMRWTASPVAELYRILRRGGVFLYPADQRRGYLNGRLRLIYEANPIALVIEQAGGAATTGRERILDLMPKSLHQHVPIFAGARDEVEHIGRLHAEPFGAGDRSPLFNRRGLFRS